MCGTFSGRPFFILSVCRKLHNAELQEDEDKLIPTLK